MKSKSPMTHPMTGPMTGPLTGPLTGPMVGRPGERRPHVLRLRMIRPANAVLFGKHLVQHDGQTVIFGA